MLWKARYVISLVPDRTTATLGTSTRGAALNK